MKRFLVGFGEYAIFLSTLCLFLLHSANGEAVCNVLSYGTKETDYAPVLRRTCCPGYGGFGSDKCLPKCDLGCPQNSHCAAPNECVCDVGYVTNESHQFYGLETMKSCKMSVVSVAVLGIIGLCVLALFSGIVVLILRKQSGYNKAKSTEAGI